MVEARLARKWHPDQKHVNKSENVELPKFIRMIQKNVWHILFNKIVFKTFFILGYNLFNYYLSNNKECVENFLIYIDLILRRQESSIILILMKLKKILYVNT